MRKLAAHSPVNVRVVTLVGALLVAIVGSTLHPASAADRPSGDVPDAGAPAYMQTQRLMEDDGGAEDLFGSDVAWDGTTLVVGVPAHDVDGDTDKGVVEIYRWNGTRFDAPIELTPTDDTEDFGRAVALHGDTIAVAAKSKERTGEDVLPFYTAYTVYIYVFNGTAWVKEAMLWSEDANAPINNFGYDIALDGDTLAAGAPDAVMDGHNRQGSVHIFTRSQGSWTRQVVVTPSNGAAQQYFGRAVALDGDTLMVGTSPLLNVEAAAYFFERVAGNWFERQIIADPNPQGNRFGDAIALDGDTVAIGDWLDVTNSSLDGHGGTVYIFARAGAEWVYQTKLGEGVNLEFGRALALTGDFLVAGAPAVKGLGSGAAHLFMHNGENWVYRGQLSPDDPSDENDRFARTLAISGETITVGAPQKTTNDGKWLGAVYVYGAAGDGLFMPMLGR